MLDPYRMVVINVIASLLLGAGLLFYRYVYPKRKPKLFFILLLLSLLPLISILRKGSYESGDLSLHTKFAMQFFDNLQQGNFIPQWIGNHCSGYGCPLYIFMFPLPYYLISLFHFLGFSFLDSTKVLIITSFIVSGIGMYLWMKDSLGEKAAFVAAIFYLYSPYHLIDLHFRVSIGELLSMAFLPFIFFGTKKLIETEHFKYFVMCSLLFGLLILSHQATALASFPLLICYGIFVWWRKKQRKISTILRLFISYGYGIALSAFYWIPVLIEGKDTYFKVTNSISFQPLTIFLYSPHRFGLLFQGHFGEYYLNVGYAQWIIIFISLFLIFKKKTQEKALLTFCVIAFAIFFFMMQSVSKPIWEYFSILKGFQFSWRLLIEIMLIVSVMAGIITKKINKSTLFILLCSFTILYTILNWGNRKTLSDINDVRLRSEPVFQEHSGAGGVDLTTPRWVDEYQPWIGKTPKNHIETLSGDATFITKNRSIVNHEYFVSAKSNALIKENTYYYPGWKVQANGKEVPIIYDNKNYQGVITFSLPKGDYAVNLTFTDTRDRFIAKVISMLIASVLLLQILWFTFRKKLERLFHNK